MTAGSIPINAQSVAIAAELICPPNEMDCPASFINVCPSPKLEALKMNKVSIVVPVYNSESYLDSCVKSLINQTYEDIEIVLVDDGSKDLSLEISINSPVLIFIELLL